MRQTPRPVLLGKFIAAFPAVKRTEPLEITSPNDT